MKGRLILDREPQNAYANMATDYALLLNCKRPTLRIYFWLPPAVSIGRFQSLKDEVDLDYCDKKGINYVRRITGGGAVFHDQELTYSFCIPVKNGFFSSDLQESYRFICRAVITGLAKIGILAEYKPINDLIVNGKKISGCAQTRKNKIILQHGTLLLDLNIREMFKVLKVPIEKISDKQISDVKQRVTCVKDEIGKQIDKEDVARFLIKGFEETFMIEFAPSILTTRENILKKRLEKEIFSNNQWTHER